MLTYIKLLVLNSLIKTKSGRTTPASTVSVHTFVALLLKMVNCRDQNL